MDEIDGWRCDGEFGDFNLVMKEKRRDMNANVEGLGLNKRRSTEGRIVGDRDVVGDKAAGEQRKAEVTEGDFASEGAGELRFKCGPKGVGVHEEGNEYQNNDKERSDDGSDFHPGSSHGTLLAIRSNCIAWRRAAQF